MKPAILLVELRGLGLSLRDLGFSEETGIDPDDLFNLNDALFSALRHDLGEKALKGLMPEGVTVPDPDAWTSERWLFGGDRTRQGTFLRAVRDRGGRGTHEVLVYRGLGSKPETGISNLVTGLALNRPDGWAILRIA